MADFQIMGFTQTEEVRGSNKVVKVREFHCRSLPSNTYFEFRRTPDQSCYTQPKICAQQFADRIEAVLGLPDVTDVDYFQDTTDAGRLRDMMRTFYMTANGAISGFVESDLAHFGPNFTGNQVEDEIARGGDLIA
jgi:hypothetical protein